MRMRFVVGLAMRFEERTAGDRGHREGGSPEDARAQATTLRVTPMFTHRVLRGVRASFDGVTVPRRGLRKIVVNGHTLAWTYKLAHCGSANCPQDWPHLVLVHGSRKGSVVHGGIPSFHGALTPKLIAELAREALAQGWVPGEGIGIRHVSLVERVRAHAPD